MSSSDDKKKALALVLEKMDKTYGKGTVMKMGDSAVEEVEVSQVCRINQATGKRLKMTQ